jgi:nucleotide-binding universal stress UspA family protein
MPTAPFRVVLAANDGSDGAFKAMERALDLAAGGAELHMVCVEELSEFPEIIEEVRAEKIAADIRYRKVVHRAREMADRRGLRFQLHLVTGHPVRSIVSLAGELGADLLVIGATGHSTFFERMIGTRADRIVEMAPCSVLVVR